jgi:hypothetical protein
LIWRNHQQLSILSKNDYLVLGHYSASMLGIKQLQEIIQNGRCKKRYLQQLINNFF